MGSKKYGNVAATAVTVAAAAAADILLMQVNNLEHNKKRRSIAKSLQLLFTRMTSVEKTNKTRIGAKGSSSFLSVYWPTHDEVRRQPDAPEACTPGQLMITSSGGQV